jgi:hypothetical protein
MTDAARTVAHDIIIRLQPFFFETAALIAARSFTVASVVKNPFHDT